MMDIAADLPPGAVLDAMESDDLVAATDRISSWLRNGASIADVIDGVIAPVLVEVGRRWHARQWTVARERRATATIDAALAAIETRFPAHPTAGRGQLVVACAEGEWHSLPARLATVRLRAAGHDVVFLGPSMRPRHIAEHLQQIEAIALGVSCTLPANLIATRRCIEAAHAIGVPVVVGGAAFEGSIDRAESVGADASWAVDDVDAFLCAPRMRGFATKSSTRMRREATDLEISLDRVVGAAMVEIALRYQPLANLDRLSTAKMEERLARLIRSIAVAIDLAEPAILTDFLAWAQIGLEARGMPDVLLLALDSVQHVVQPAYPRATVLVRRAAAALREGR